MFCPYCGAKNAEGGGQCFVCEKRLPNFDESSPRSRSSSPAAKQAAASGEPIAALGDRFIAVILDTIFLAALFSIGVLAISRWPQLQSFFPSPFLFVVSVVSAAVLLSFIYYWVLEGAFGATLGKAVAGIHVRPTHGIGRIGFRASLWRNLFRIIDGLGFYFLGYLIALFSRQNRRIGDYAAGTIVVQRNMAWGERVTVVLLWMVGVAGLSWGAYTLCPRCVDLQVARVVEQLGIDKPGDRSALTVPHLASN